MKKPRQIYLPVAKLMTLLFSDTTPALAEDLPNKAVATYQVCPILSQIQSTNLLILLMEETYHQKKF